jgi:transposase-like protein
LFYHYPVMVIAERDVLPQDIQWRDQGCELFPSCLNCPRPRCIEDEPRGKQKQRSQARARRMGALRGEGKTVRQIAEVYGVSVRTVQRALERVRREGEGTR